MSRFVFRAAAVSLVVVFASTASALPTGKSELAPAKPPPGPPTFQEPQWPVRFDLHLGERSTSAFAVGTAGPIAIDVTFNGEPITVTLRKPDGTSVDLHASQSPFSYKTAATDADVKAGPLWAVSVRTTRDPVPFVPAPGSPAPTSTQAAKPILNGTVSVAHPAGNASLVAQAIAKAYAAPPPARPTKPIALQAPDVVAAKNAELDKLRAGKRLAALDQIKSRLPADVTLRATKTFGAVQQPATSTTSAAAVGVAGSNAPATVASDPTIASLSVAEGEPGDPVLVTGSAFSGTQGEVHFIVANGKDLAAPITAWNDTQILAAVPTITGVPSYAGYVYVQRGAQKSKLVPFKFKPTLEYKTLTMTADRRFSTQPAHVWDDIKALDYWYPFILGGKGDDEYFLNTRLKNEWVADSAYTAPGRWWSSINTEGSGNAYVSELRAGTDSPYVKVHWWADAFSSVVYQVFVVVKGPKGLPEQ